MMAYTVEMVSVERVMSCINRYSSAEPSHSDGHVQELPYDTEDAIITWINKVNEHLRDILVEEQKLRETSFQESNAATQKARYRKEHAQQRSSPSLPLVENLLKDNTDGCALTTLLHFYCSQVIRLEDICLKETMSLADSLYNLQLVQEFCRNNLNHCCHFSLEDMLYAHASIKSNYLVFMAELFWWFEVVKPSFVQPRVFNPDACEPVSSCRKMAPVSSPLKQRYADRPDSPESIPAEGGMKRSTAMSYADDCTGTWPKEKRSSSRGISFEIPLDGDPTVPPCEAPSLRGMTRSASSDGLGFKVHFASRGGIKRHLSLMPISVNGQSKHIPEDDEDFTSHKPLGRNNTFSVKNQSRYSNGVLPDSSHNHHGNHSDHISPSTPPSIEEALKIIHDTERPHASLSMGDGDNGFFLHSAEPSDPPGDQGQGDDPGSAKALPNDHDPNSISTEEVDTGIHVRTEDIQSLDEDSSSLRDYSDIDPDCEAMTRSCPLSERSERERSREAGRKGVGDANPEGERGVGSDRSSPCPSSAPTLPRSHTASPASSSGGSGGGMVRMTSFAEQKFRKLEGRSSGGTTPESSDLNAPYIQPPKSNSSQISAPPLPITSPSPVTPSPRDPSHLIASEMIQLRMKLEEKRRAIEAQKKKVEAAFTRHRQKMGRTAFLNVVRRKGVTAPLCSGGAETPSPEPLTPSKETSQGSMERAERCKPDGAAPKSPCEDGGSVAPGEIDLADYTRSIERLNTSLGFLQTEMQRLSQQQEKIMAMREHQQQQQAWVIPPPAPSPHRQLRELRSSSVTGRGSGRGSVGSLSPILSSSGSPHAPNRSPAGIKRRPASFHARTPRTPRPNDLKVTPFSRMLNTPTSVDSLPRLRRFNSSQTQLSSFAYLGHDDGQAPRKNQEAKDNKESTKDKEETVAKESAGTPQPSTKEAAKEKEDGSQDERKQTEQARSKGEAKQTRSSEVLCQPVSEIQGPKLSRVKGDSQDRRDLVEVPLSGLKPPGRPPGGQETSGEGEVEGEAGGDIHGDDQKMCCGFFFKDDVKGEEDMAAKKAALLEKRMRREREAQERKQQQDQDQEQRREVARLKAEEEQQKKDEEKARREYIRNEYLRKKQLKLMVDMDEVIKPRSGSLKKKPRPKSIHRDVMESSTPPVRATGVRPRGFSVSSVSLASLNLADNDRDQPNNRKNNRPDSAEGFSSCPSTGSRNGENNWENDSTTSSTPSNAEYTGPKLYKEPSAKSNKHIIQNALAHCCLAGKVNEGQKNKILDEMEKSEANNFLVLFRDSGCQFRSVYTYCPETEEITRLAGIGPRNITTKMIEGLYKYNSDRKQFSQIPAKTMSASVDAITIASHLWQTKKQGTPKKLHTK
nr:calmodulin-regulated spectrin-associated protein 2 isoform X2 [Scatophagus argus]